MRNDLDYNEDSVVDYDEWKRYMIERVESKGKKENWLKK